MLLSKYLKENKVKKGEFCKAIGIHWGSLHRYLRGDRQFPPKIAVEIERVTGGKVTRLEALWPDEFDGIDDD